MNKEFFSREYLTFEGRLAISVKTPFPYSLKDTLECGQCFRYEEIKSTDSYSEYLIPVGNDLLTVGQRKTGELLFFNITEEQFEGVARPYFSLDTDYALIKEEIKGKTDSPWLRRAADAAEGVVILSQDPWEALFSFIVSQNNNIPRIRKIIRELSIAYGVNIALQKSLKKCPCGKISGTPCEEKCKNCGVCYSFPKAEDVARQPNLMLPSRPGFRYKYLLDAAEKVTRGEVDLEKIKSFQSYERTVEALTVIKGVGLKVASCAALFGFGNLDAFPIDVWMKRAIDEYFDGKLDAKELGEYAGVAQQYIFHYIRNIKSAD